MTRVVKPAPRSRIERPARHKRKRHQNPRAAQPSGDIQQLGHGQSAELATALKSLTRRGFPNAGAALQ